MRLRASGRNRQYINNTSPLKKYLRQRGLGLFPTADSLFCMNLVGCKEHNEMCVALGQLNTYYNWWQPFIL